MNAMVITGSRKLPHASCANVVARRARRRRRTAASARTRCSAATNTERAGGGQEIETVGQRIGLDAATTGDFALHRAPRALPSLHPVGARPVELPHREIGSPAARRRRSVRPTGRDRAIAALAALEQRASRWPAASTVDMPAKLPIWPISTVTIRMP